MANQNKGAHIKITLGDFEQICKASNRIASGRARLLYYLAVQDVANFKGKRIVRLHERINDYCTLVDAGKTDMARYVELCEKKHIDCSEFDKAAALWQGTLRRFKLVGREWFLGTNKNNAVVTVTASDIDRVANTCIKFAEQCMFILVCWAMNRTYGWGPVRLSRIEARYRMLDEEVRLKHICLKDIKDVMHDEAKLTFDDKLPDIEERFLRASSILRNMYRQWNGVAVRQKEGA